MAGGSGRFEHSSLQQWKAQEKQPAAPEGMRQGAAAAGGYESGGGRFENSKLGQWVSEQGYTGAAQTWYTGANREGTNNGWDTDFWNRTFEQNKMFGEQGKLGTQFEQPNATGVVTWDHDSSDGRHHFTFGDVFDGGKKVGNVFHQFDKPTADLMMADILFDGKTKAEIFSDSDHTARLAREVGAKREQNNTEIPKMLTAADFNGKVEKRAKSFEDGHVDDAITAGGVLGGAAVGAGAGAAAGAAFFGVGALPGAIGGAILGALGGGAGAEMNKDALAEQAARAYEITSMSKRENGSAAAYATGVSQWSGFAGSLISPLQNLNRGYADVRGSGRRGDGRSEFYRVDDQNHRTVPKWLRVTDVVAAVGDSALQFASPIGVSLYTTQMSGTIGGEVAELGLAHGKTFDYTRGDFDNIFTDDHGKRDLSAAAAGIGKIGIDAVQLGMVRGLAGKVDAVRASVGEKTAFGSLLGMPQRLSRNVLPARLGGRTAEEKAALAAGGHETEAAGHRFVLDAEGKVVGKHATMSLLAPSEQLVSLSARVQASRLAAKAQRTTVSADDFYRAANALATGQSRWRTALVNGMGEGYEEAAQAILEPHSHNESVSMSDIGNAALYGFAMGAGMGVGMGARMPGADEKMMSQAFLAQSLRTGTEGDLAAFKKDWKSKTEAEKRAAAAMSNLERATTNAAYRQLATDQAIERSAGVVGTAKLRDAIAQQLASNLAKGTDRTDGSFVVAPIEDTGRVDAQGNLLPGSMPGDAVVASGLQTVRNLSNRLRGHEVQVDSLNRDLEQVAAELAKDPGNQDLVDRQTQMAADLATAQRVVDRGNEILADLDQRLDAMYDPTLSPAQVEAEVETANAILRDLFHERTPGLSAEDSRAMARAVSMLFTRDPQDQAGSYQVLVPQISVPLTISRSDDVLQVPSGILAAISGDHDGDKIRPQNQLILSEEDFVSARSGAFFLGAGSTVNIAAPKDEKENVERMSQALASPNSALANFAAGTLTNIGTAVRHRYGQVVEAKVLDAVLDRFYAEVHANNKDARNELVNGLARLAGGPLTEFSRNNLSNEWLWLDHLLRANFQQFQESFAAHRPLLGDAPNTTRVAPNRQSTAVKERRMQRAANTGTTVGLLLAGDSPFRQAQKLHYSSLVANVLSAEQGGAREDIYALAQLYEALGQGMTRSELDEIRAKDEITGRVYARLKRVALEAQRLDPSLGGVESLAVVANLRISDVDLDVEGTPTANGKQLSLAQFLLKQSVAQDRREKDAIFDASPELQAKHARLLAMTRPPTQGVRGSKPVNAERAFVEVVGSQQLFTLLGDAADVFGPHLTVEQWIRGYVSLDENSRRAEDNKLRGEAEYIGRKSSKNLPYDLGEVAAGEVTAYRALVDAMLAVGHNRITIDHETAASKETGSRHLHGELAKRHYDTSEAFQSAHTRIREAIFTFSGLSRRRDGELSPALVARMFEGNPDFARQVMDLIPNNYANAVLEARGDGVYVANWVHDMFVMSDPAQAEMHFWRNLLLAEWNAKGVNFSNEEEDEDGASGRKYHGLKRRMHRIMFNLAAQDDNGLLYEKFIREMESATSLEMFLRWVNTTPGVRGDQAPIVGWVDDPAEFDADKAGGGWTNALAGSELREAITSLQRGADALVKDLAEEQAAVNADVSTIAAIRRVLNGTGTTDDQALHDQMVQRISDAGEMAVGLGPQAMIYEIVGAARGFYPQAHTKGKNPSHLVAPGSFDAGRDAFGYTTNYERVLAGLTATNLDALGSNMSQIAKDAGRTMDDYGRPVTWTKPDVAQVLDLLEDPDTRPMARAMLFPQAMERTFDGTIRPQLLVGKSLVSLLDGTSLKDLFPKADTLRQDPALRYLTMVQAEARRFGGHFSVMRAATDIVAARQSAADHTLSDYELEQMTVSALHEIAQVLQASGSVAAADAVRGPGADTLGEYLTEVRKAQKQAHLSRQLGQEIGDETATRAVVSELTSQREAEAEAEKQLILAALGPNSTQAEADRAAVRVSNIEAEVDRFKERMDLLLEDNLVDRAVSMYGWPSDQAAQVEARRAITDFIFGNFHMMETASASLITLSKLTEQVRDSGRAGNVDLSDAEWDELSRAVIGVYLDRVASSTGAGISVAPFPDADHADDHRYYDRTFSYLAEPLMDPTSPLVLAAKRVHERAGRHGEETRADEFYRLLDRTLFAEFSLGQWTSDIPRTSIEANQRLDSSSAEAAIAMPGNSPKRQAVVSAATRRTFAVPGDEHMSTARLSWLDLNAGSVFDEVQVVMPSGMTSRPLAQLNNRFARSVTLTYTDAAGDQQQVDLLAADRDLGRVWHGDDRAAGAGLQEIHLNRIAHSVDTYLAPLGVNPAGALVDVEFVHPDSQPEGPEWFNNLFFEGTSFAFDGDRHESLNETLWFSSGGLNQSYQRAALDASKTGKPALQVVPTPAAAEVAAFEQTWQTDFAAMLRAKARKLFESELGIDVDPAEFYNAVYKDLKLRHFVRGQVDGEPVLWSAEQMLAHHQATPGMVPPIDNATLWIPTDDVLRSLLGEQGTQGVARIFDDQLEIDPTMVPTYRGVTDTMRERFAAGLTEDSVALHQTRLMARARQQQLVVRARMDDAARAAYDTRMRFLAEQRQEIHAARAAWSGTAGPGGFNPKRNMVAALQRADGMLRAENIAFDWAGEGGIPFVGPRSMNNLNLSRMLMRDLETLLSDGNGSRAGWIFREGDESHPPTGLLTGTSLDGKEPTAMRVAAGDLVVVELDSFRGDWKQAAKRLDYLANRGATIVLGSGDGTNDGRAEMAEHLESLNYERIAGSKHVYRPADFSSRYANQRARTSTLMEMRPVSKRNHAAILNVVGKGIQEGGAWVDHDNPRLRAIGTTLNLVPTDFLAGFNVPVEQVENDSQVSAVIAHLRGLDTPEGRDHLRALAGAENDDTFDPAWEALMRRLDDNRVLPAAGETFGTGDMIPLVDGLGRVLLYRHGNKAPRRDQVDVQAATPLSGELDGARVAIFPSKPEEAATTHRGRVVQFKPRSVSGLSVELEIDLKTFGEKHVLEWNGMKYILTPRPADRIAFPDHGFFPDWGIDLVTDTPGIVSKEAFDGLVNNHRNAFAYLGIDFTGDVATYFGTDAATAVALLHGIATRAERIPVRAADELMNAARPGSAFVTQMAEIATAMSGKVDPGWVNRLEDEQSVEAQIVRALVIYLSTPGARVDDVLRSGGFNDDTASPDAQSLLMPRLFTQVFDNAPLGSALRTDINRRLNEQLHNPRADGTGYVLHQDWSFEVRTGSSSSGTATARAAALVSATDRGGWASKLRRAKQKGTSDPRDPNSPSIYDALAQNGFDSSKPIVLEDLSKLKPGALPKIFSGHHRLVAALDLGLTEIPYRYEGDPDPEASRGMFQLATAGGPGQVLVGHLQFAEVHSSGDSPVKNGMSFDESGTAQVSAHAAATAYQAIGARTAHAKDLSRARDFAAGTGLTRFERDKFDGGAWRMLTDIDASSGARWRAQAPAEAARRSLARDAVVQFRQALDTSDESGWDAAARKDYGDVVRQVLHTLHLKDGQTELVDFWVRQMLGSPAGVDKDGNDVGRVSPKAALESAKDVLWNVERGYLPTVTAMVPLTHVHDLQAIFRANRTRTDKWAPRTALDADAAKATSWNEWVTTSLGSAFTTDDLFDPLYLLALDGHMHTYQAATRDLLDLPVSMDALKSVELVSPEANEMLVSLDPNQNLLATEPGLLDVTRATLDDMIGGQRQAGVLEGKAAPASEIAKKREAIRKWRKENGVPVPVDVTMRNFRKNGAQFIEHSTVTNALARGLVNLRVGTAMINPALYVSMGPEQWVRGTLDRAANLLTGQATVGVTAGLAAQAGLSRFSPEQLGKLTRLYEQLGQRRDFKQMVYGDLMFLRPHEPGVGRIERWLENYAKFGSKMQDPTWGMRATTLARRYLEAAMQHIDAMPTESTLTPDRLVAELTTDPQFLKTHFPEVHQSAMNSIAQLRSLKQTTASSMLKGIYEPFSTSTHSSVNFLGNVLLKMPLIFSGYAMNVLTTITGLQGLDAVVAASLHGRQKGLPFFPNTLIGRAQAAVEGVEFDEQKHGEFDMSSVMDGIDLSRAFIRGGLTHTALFMFGMAAGGLGLSGEDDETKKRRRLAKLQGAGFIYDPRALENDFRNQDAVFMDWLPFGSQWWGVGKDVDGDYRSIGQLHWTLKQFVSPLLGFERFYETGDFRQVTWGFQDAIGSFPLINSLMWHDAMATANEFTAMANDEAGKPGGPANMVHSSMLLTNAVGVYERMLFENAFVNQLYSSFDRYDRDPYKLPLRDSDGTLQRDIEGNAREQNLSVEQYLAANRDQLTREIAGGKWEGALYVDPDTGEVKQGYMTRDANSARLHALTENRATMAFAMSLFTGLGESDYFRKNMPIKTREIEKPQITQDQAEAAIRSLAQATSGGQPALTRDELTYLIKGQAIKGKDWDTWNNADALAAEGMKHMTVDPMSILDAHGREVLTEAGARGIFKGLAKGSVKLDSQSLQGIYIPFEMRESIQKKWMSELIQEGVDMGLDQTKATSRMKRMWYGPTDDPTIQGLGDILWHKDISYSGKAVYNQLNTTYVMGPDGMPWATGFTRDGLMGALGLKPVKRAYVSEQGATGNDGRLNTTDLVNGMNTGLRGLELVDDSRYVPTDVEIGKSIEQAIKDAAKQDYTPFKPYSSSGSGGGGYGGYRKFGHYSGYRRRHYGGGGYGGGGSYFTKMYALPHGTSTYANNIPFINTSNPLIRRGDVRRERVWSERGRLKQWQ